MLTMPLWKKILPSANQTAPSMVQKAASFEENAITKTSTGNPIRKSHEMYKNNQVSHFSISYVAPERQRQGVR